MGKRPARRIVHTSKPKKRSRAAGGGVMLEERSPEWRSATRFAADATACWRRLRRDACGFSRGLPVIDNRSGVVDTSRQHHGDDEIVARLRAGDERALGELLDGNRERLWRMVSFRMDRRMASRIDPDDVLQEAYVAAAARLHHYLSDTSCSPFVWLRSIVAQTLIDVHRRHLGAKMRDAHRDVSVVPATYPNATSVSLAAELLASVTSPSQAAAREEVSEELRRAIDDMSQVDQEIIALRHFEDLTNAEAAEVLGIQPTAASNRYVRAIARLKDVLLSVPGVFSASRDGA